MALRAPALCCLLLAAAPGCALVHDITTDALTFGGAAAGTLLGGPVGGGVGAVLGRHAGVIAAGEVTGMQEVLVEKPKGDGPRSKETGMSFTFDGNTVLILGLMVAAYFAWKGLRDKDAALEKKHEEDGTYDDARMDRLEEALKGKADKV